MPLTQKELARRLGVSQMTVSRAMRDHPHVDEKVRATILRAARRFGYSLEANHAAEVLRRRARGEPSSTHILCAMVNIPQDANDDESFHGQILKGISEGARATGWEVVLPVCSLQDTPLVVARRQVDGVVRLLTQHRADQGNLELPLPWVSVLFDVKGADVVTVDNVEAGLKIGRHLCAQGHRRIAFIGPVAEISQQRLQGLRLALKEVGAALPSAHVALEANALSVPITVRLLDTLLAQTGSHPPKLPFTAIVAYNDYMAVSIWRHLRSLGVQVPRDVSVAGFDGAVPRGFRDVRVTTAAMPLERMGAEAVRLLEKRFAQPNARRQRLVLDTSLQAGETTAVARTP